MDYDAMKNRDKAIGKVRTRVSVLFVIVAIVAVLMVGGVVMVIVRYFYG